MKIERKTIRRATAGGGSEGANDPLKLVVGSTEYTEENKTITIPQGVNSIEQGGNSYFPDNEGKVTLPSGGSVESVSANGTTYTPDGQGDVNLGGVVKSIEYIRNTYTPDANGKVTINTIAGYFASGLNGLNVNGTTQRPLEYDPTTQHLLYSLDSSNTTTSLRLMRKSGRNAESEAYELTFEIVARVVSADETSTRLLAYIDTDVKGELPSLQWALTLQRYVAGSTPLGIAIKGFTDAPNYWTANDADLRQGSYSGTSGFRVDSVDDDDTTKYSVLSLAAHSETFANRHKRYVLDIEFFKSPAAVTLHSFSDISRGAVGTAAVRVNGSTYQPDTSGLVDLGNIGGGGGAAPLFSLTLGGQQAGTWYVIKIPKQTTLLPTIQFTGDRFALFGQTDNGYNAHDTKKLQGWGFMTALLIMPRANADRAIFVYTIGLNSHYMWLGGRVANTYITAADIKRASSTTSASAAVAALEQQEGETYSSLEAVATAIDADTTIVDKAASDEYIVSVWQNGTITTFQVQ
jgi:hypothetical protein